MKSSQRGFWSLRLRALLTLVAPLTGCSSPGVDATLTPLGGAGLPSAGASTTGTNATTGSQAGAAATTTGDAAQAGNTGVLANPGAGGGGSVASGVAGAGGMAALGTGAEGGPAGAPVAVGGGAGAGTTQPDDVPSLIGDVQFSVPSGTFQGSLSVGLTGPAGAELRYTTDGTLPTATSTLYDGTALAFTGTTQLRAQAFTSGAATGLPSTAIYVARTFDVEADIPIVIMEGYGGGRPQKQTAGFGGGNTDEPIVQQELIDLAFMLFEPVNGVAKISNPPVLATRAGYRERGQSSAGAEKSPYKVEFWDNSDEDADYPVLGMPAEADWAMIGEAFDSTQLQNSLVYSWGAEMGLETVELRFVELYINFDGGPLEETDYFGLYALTETIKNQKNRLDLKQLDDTVTTLPEITGGYIFKFDQSALDGGETELMCTGSEPLARGGSDETALCWNDLGMVDPDVLNAEQLAYLNTYVQEFHDVLHQTPIGDYAQYIDVPSFVDHVIINEITRDVDAYVRSSFFHKEREGLIHAGPLWDYNLALTSFSADAEGWHFESQLTGRGNDDWFYRLGSDPAFLALVGARWRELRQTFLADAAIVQRIDELAAPITNAALHNQERWGAQEGEEGPGGGFGGFGGPIGDWQESLTTLKSWIPTRMAWIDANVPAP